MIRKLNLPFLEQSTPPPFYQDTISDKKRHALDKAFIGKESEAYYLRQFAYMDQCGKLSPSFNWAAFMMTFAWLLYRKRFLDCFVYCVAGWSFIKLNIVIVVSVVDFLLIGYFDSAYHWAMRIGVGLMVWLFWAYQVGRWGNAYYYRQARREIADALALYPHDVSAQHRHLAEHGGISWLGAMVALGLFGSMVSVVALSVVPLWAAQQEQTVIHQGYLAVYQTHKHIESIYQTTNQCPIDLPLADDKLGQWRVVGVLDGVQTDCAVVLTLQGVAYPTRYLNGQTISLYRTKHTWRCITSLNQEQAPMWCIGG